MSFDIIFNPFGIIGEARFNIYNYWSIHDCARARLIVELTSPFHYIYIYIYFFFFRISLYTFYFWKYPSLKQLFTGWTKLILDYILYNSPFIIVKNPIGEFVKFYALLPAFYEPFRRLNDFSRIQNPRSNRGISLRSATYIIQWPLN